MGDVEVIKFVVHPRAFDTEFRSRQGSVGRFMIRLGKEAGVRARAMAPIGETAELKGGIIVRTSTGGVHGDIEQHVIAVPKHAKYVIKGTRRHIIRARRFPTMKFFWPKVGHIVHFTKVKHPGTKPNNFLLRAVRRSVGRLR